MDEQEQFWLMCALLREQVYEVLASRRYQSAGPTIHRYERRDTRQAEMLDPLLIGQGDFRILTEAFSKRFITKTPMSK